MPKIEPPYLRNERFFLIHAMRCNGAYLFTIFKFHMRIIRVLEGTIHSQQQGSELQQGSESSESCDGAFLYSIWGLYMWTIHVLEGTIHFQQQGSKRKSRNGYIYAHHVSCGNWTSEKILLFLPTTYLDKPNWHVVKAFYICPKWVSCILN